MLARCLLFLLPCVCALPAFAGSPDLRTIRLKVAAFDPETGIPEIAGLPSRERYPPAVRGGYLVQFERPIEEADRLALEQAGASVKGYLPMMTLEVVMSETSRAAVESIPGVRWVGLVQPGYKLSPRLREALAPHLPHFESTRRLSLQVSLFPGEEDEALDDLRALGRGAIRLERGRSVSLAWIDLPAGQLQELLAIPLVRFVERVYRRKAHNDRSRFHTGLSVVADDTFSSGLDPSLDGRDDSSGFQVKYGHLDTGIYEDHPDFQFGRAQGWLSFESGADRDDTDNGHGTHTAGSIIGDGSQWNTLPAVPPGSGSISQDRWRGVQPEAALHHLSFELPLSDRQIFEREAEVGAQISTNSWGYCEPRGPFFCDSIVDYNTNAAVWDDGVWDADDDAPGLQPLIVFFSAGNDGAGASNGCGSAGSDQIGSPGTAKNVITVGANETDRGCGVDGDHVGDVTFFSSRGPVDPDASGVGLFKPDVTNVGGLWVLSTEADGTGGSSRDSPSSCSNTGSHYRYEAGTSMSCPLTAGLGGVVLQDLVVNRGVSSPSPSLVKALLVNGARDLSPSGGCDYSFETTQSEIHQGWGLVQATDSLYGAEGTPGQRRNDFENEVTAHALATGGVYERSVAVPTGATFKVTLVWTDFPAAPASGSPLIVNDLDLEVLGPEGTFLGNDFAGNWSVPAGAAGEADRYNVVENVYIEGPAGGSYTLRVRGFQVSQDQEPDRAGVQQDFSLVWSIGPLPACADSLDNDGDGEIDFPDDPGCDDAADLSEKSAALVCDDGLDNDGDGLIDFPEDPQCTGPGWPSEKRRRRCGLGFELVFWLPLVLLGRRRLRVPRRV